MSNYSPLISVIIPFYNSRFDYFIYAINTVLCQSYKNWEVIIVNDGSTFENKIFLEDYISNLNDRRISILHLDKNHGPSTAYNKGIESASGEIITWLDSDDLYLPWYFEKVTDFFLNNSDCSVLFIPVLFYLSLWKIKRIHIHYSCTKALEEKEDLKNLLTEIKQGTLSLFPLPFFKREAFKKISFDPDIRLGEDNDLYCQIFNNDELLNRAKVASFAGYLYRIYPSTSRITHRKDLRFQDMEKIINKYKNKNSLATNNIKAMQARNDIWKFCHLLNDYLQDGSLINYFKNVLSEFKSLKDRIKSIRVLLNMFFIYNFLVPMFGIGSKYKDMLFSLRGNKYKKIKSMFINYLNKLENEDEITKLNKAYEGIF